MRHEFLPAIGPYVTDPRQWRHPIHWLDQKTPVYYPRYLASYALWRDSNYPPPQPHGTVRFGDSGGYTLVTKGDSIDPTEVIRWQLKYCTRGVILDVPPYRPGSAIQFRGSAGEWWEDSISRTLRNVRRSLSYYQNPLDDLTMAGFQPVLVPPAFKWWGVVQGESRDQMVEWHGKISEIYPFDKEGEGWALAPKPSTDLLSCTRYMRFAHDRGIRNVHLLQVTAEGTVALILALAQISGQIDLVTYDSASALRCAINRSAVIPDGLGISYIKESRTCAVNVDETCPKCHHIGYECSCPGNETTVSDFMKQCLCKACQWFREFYPETNSEYPHTILLHNHIVMQEAFERIFTAAQADPDRVLRWVCGPLYGDVLREWEGTHIRSKSQSRVVPLTERI